MSKKRFLGILRCVYLLDNKELEEADRLGKVPKINVIYIFINKQGNITFSVLSFTYPLFFSNKF